MRTYQDIPRPAFTPDFITELKPDEVFVFGSNLAGSHGGGAAYVAWRNRSSNFCRYSVSINPSLQ